MRKKTTSKEANYRLLKAVAVTMALVIAAPGADAVVRFVAAPKTAAAATEAFASIDSTLLLDAYDAFASLERIEGIADAGGAAVPDAFAQEIGLLSGARDVRVSADGSVVGYMVDDACESVLERLNERMESLGWSSVSLGGASGATYVKASGACTWALVTCLQVEGATSVVARWVVA